MTSPAMGSRRAPTQDRARFTRATILEATARLLEEELGGASPSTNRIAKVAGVSIGTLYQYFEGRPGIVRALVLQHAEDMHAVLARQTGDHLKNPRDAVSALVHALADAHAVAPRLHLALLRELLVDGGELLPLIENPARELVYAWLLRHADEVRPKDLDAASWLLTHSVEAAIHGQLLQPRSRLADPAFRAELTDLVLRYLLP